MVEVMKATAAISVVEDYKALGKLNLRELSMIGDDAEDEPTTSKKADAEDNTDLPEADTKAVNAGGESAAAKAKDVPPDVTKAQSDTNKSAVQQTDEKA